MACPYFFPVARMEEDLWAVPPRLPLLDAYTGECRAHAGAVTRTACYTGYARGLCEHFPSDAPADAIRFHVTSDSAAAIVVKFILEKACWPGDHGDITFSLPERACAAVPGNAILARQAEAFLESYLRRSR
jgi:hypothetical protein